MSIYLERDLVPLDKTFSPKQAEAYGLIEDFDNICLCWGRRCGKTDIASLMSQIMMWRGARPLIEAVARGERPPWSGIGKRKALAANHRPDARAWVVAPTEDHLQEIRGHLFDIYSEGAEDYFHPELSYHRRGREFWFLYGGVSICLSFIPAVKPASLVGKGLIHVYVDEGGLISNERYAHLSPSLWDQAGSKLVTGTPDPDTHHWMTRLAVSGLPKGHERADHKIAQPDPDVRTVLANTIEHAYLQRAREQSAKEAQHRGEAYAALWIYADWRRKSSNVYREWRNELHVRRYVTRHSRWWLGNKRLRHPDEVIGSIDWTGGSAPGACIVVHVWAENPIDEDDPRPLIVIVDEHQGYDAYTDDGWWGIMRNLEVRWGVHRWIADPHAPRLIQQAIEAGFAVDAGPHADKMGRIAIVASHLHHTVKKGEENKRQDPDAGEKTVIPALYVSSICEHAARQFNNYGYRVNKVTQEITNTPRDYDDHVLDCVAMVIPEVGSGAIWIGHEHYG